MAKIVISERILEDAYMYAYSNIERGRYRECERALDFVEANDKIEDIERFEFMRVIIFANTNRVAQAVELCDKMIARGLSPAFDETIRSMRAHYSSRSNAETEVNKQLATVTTEDVKALLDKVRPTDSRLSDFIQFFSTSVEIENMLIKYYFENTYIVSKPEIEMMLKKMVLKARAISDVIESCNADNPKLYAVLNKMIVTAKGLDDLFIFMYLHQSGKLRPLLIEDKLEPKTRSVIAYKLNQLYQAKCIGRIKIDMTFNGEIYEEYISELGKSFQTQYTECFEQLSKIFDSGLIPANHVMHMMTMFDYSTSYTFPVVNPLRLPADRYIAAFLYVISNNNYEGKFNAIIDDVYNFQQSDLAKEIEMLEVLILI